MTCRDCGKPTTGSLCDDCCLERSGELSEPEVNDGITNSDPGSPAQEIAVLRQWVNDLQSGMYINCAYCGHRYGPKFASQEMRDRTEPIVSAALTKHIEQCPKHPMSALKAENAELKLRIAKLESGINATVDPSKRKALLEIAKRIAPTIAQAQTDGTCTSDDIFRYLREMGEDPKHLGNAVAAVFRGKKWKFTGRFKKSGRGNNHGRALRIWQYQGGEPCNSN